MIRTLEFQFKTDVVIRLDFCLTKKITTKRTTDFQRDLKSISKLKRQRDYRSKSLVLNSTIRTFTSACEAKQNAKIGANIIYVSC